LKESLPTVRVGIEEPGGVVGTHEDGRGMCGALPMFVGHVWVLSEEGVVKERLGVDVAIVKMDGGEEEGVVG